MLVTVIIGNDEVLLDIIPRTISVNEAKEIARAQIKEGADCGDLIDPFYGDDYGSWNIC